MTSIWHDKDRRRAALLSLLLHIVALVALVIFVSVPRPTPLEPFVVIEVGTPAPADVQTDAAAVDAPAPETPTPQVEADRVGRPVAAPPPEPPETPPVAEPAEPVEPVVEPPVAEPAPVAQPEEPAQAEPDPPEVEDPVEAEAPPPRPAPPSPVTPAQSAVAESLPGTPATPLPEVEQEELAPRPLAESIPLPLPTVTAELPEVRDIAPQPRAEVSAPQAVPQPNVSVQVADAQAVPRPNVTATVPIARDVPTPSVRTSVASARNVPAPAVRADVATAGAIPRPAARADVAAATPVPRPAAAAAVASGRDIPTPSVRAAVTAPPAREEGIGAANVPAGAAAPVGNRPGDAPAGGNAVAPGQPDPPGEAAGVGLATGEGDGTGVRARPEPYSAFRRQPVAVLIDNANGYPQSGLVEAAVVVEMPVEGGLTRLMPLYDDVDPPTVGPVRSARDYFVRISESYDGVLVHDGGSPSAMQAISQSPTPTLNAFSRGELFARADGRTAPYNLYSSGNSLRSAVNRLRSGGVRAVSGMIYRPTTDAREVASVSVRYGGTYETGFSYQPALGSYRWVRNGTPAVDANGDQVRTDAILIADIEARPFPNDPAGRLYIPLDGGSATLYLLGRAVDGRWYLDGGVRFEAADGTPVDLRPFKTWMAFAPGYEGRTER